MMTLSQMDDFQIYTFTPSCQETKRVEKGLFFAHANGIPALTYRTFFEKMAQQLDMTIVTYDMRGIGHTKACPVLDPKKWGWEILIQDHKRLFEEIKNKHHGIRKWTLSGHSLGAWLSLFSARSLSIDSLLLFDPPILPPRTVAVWSFLCLINKRELNPNGRKVKKRKTVYPSFDAAYKHLSQSAFLKNWPKEVILDYLEGSFEQKNSEIVLRHDPVWEAHLFDSYPFNAAAGFLKIPYSFRKNIKPIFLVGEKSTVCNVRAQKWVKFFLPKCQWLPIVRGSHMFPFEEQEKTLSLLKKIL